jgi:glycosidase
MSAPQALLFVARPARAARTALRGGVAWAAALLALPVHAADASQPALLQLFEARWSTVEDRMADVFQTGYGGLWLPPAARAGSVFSVGYDVFDRFDLGAPRNETHYGTSEGFRAAVAAAQRAGVQVHVDLILNHNGVGNRLDANFVTLGGYPGFALTLPGDVDGDFHDPSIDALSEDALRGQLAGLNDLAQEKNHLFIRRPAAAGDPRNIPAGSQFNRPDPRNAAFYPDRDAGGFAAFDTRLGRQVVLYDYRPGEPLAGDPVADNALGELLRNVRWMVQEYGVDGFRIDAARHFPRWVLDYFDQATFRARRTPYLDGSPRHVYSFSETGWDSAETVQSFIRRDIDDAQPSVVGGNRDALDFRLFNALRDNLSANGAANNWHAVRKASIDLNDDGLLNGSQGVAFVQSHDEQGAFLLNVAHAYALLLPGQALVYLNAEQYGPTGSFPQPGKVDALGGAYGETIARLVELRNSHGRGDFRERWIDDAFNPQGFSNFYAFERSRSLVAGFNSRNDGTALVRQGVQTDFAPGTVLVELTGNAADPAVDPAGNVPEALRVNAAGQIDLRVPGNAAHGRGYLAYGLAAPQGRMTLGPGLPKIAGAVPSAATNGVARLADLHVVTGDFFEVLVETDPVALPAPSGESLPVRDAAADGDNALLRIDGGLDLNGNGAVDFTDPGGVIYGFEQFVTERQPGFRLQNGTNVGTGSGRYRQIVDARQLAEGRHYVTARAFRHRGDGGPPIFRDFRETVYVDRLPPEAAVVRFEPFATAPQEPWNRDLIVRSTDQTADNMHFFLNLPPNVSDEEILRRVQRGEGDAGSYDRDQFIYGFFGLATGHQVATVVAFEPTGRSNIQRFTGLFVDAGRGAGFGDMDADGSIEGDDVAGPASNSFENLLFSRGNRFHPAADLDGDGAVTTLDLFDLGDVLLGGAAAADAADAYRALLRRRADVNADGRTDDADAAWMYAGFGTADWFRDLDVDGLVDLADVALLVDVLSDGGRGDFDLDGRATGRDLLAWQRGTNAASGARFDVGDANLDGRVDAADFVLWTGFWGSAGGAAAPVPEPSTGLLLGAAAALPRRRSRWKIRRDASGGTTRTPRAPLRAAVVCR